MYLEFLCAGGLPVHGASSRAHRMMNSPVQTKERSICTYGVVVTFCFQGQPCFVSSVQARSHQHLNIALVSRAEPTHGRMPGGGVGWKMWMEICQSHKKNVGPLVLCPMFTNRCPLDWSSPQKLRPCVKIHIRKY